MARSTRSKSLETRTKRFELKEGKRHNVTIGQGLILLYRRGAKSSTWYAKIAKGDGGYLLQNLGQADDHQDATGVDILSYFQAQEKARELALELKRNKGVIFKPLTVAKAAEQYLAWYATERKALKETTATINAHILPHFGERLASELATKEITTWHRKLATTPPRRRIGKFSKRIQEVVKVEATQPRKSTANRILTVLKAILNKAFQDDLIFDDKAWRKVKPFENTDEAITRFLTSAESERLINSCSADFRLLVKAALFTGARYGDLCRMKVSQFNADTRKVYISPEGKNSKGRYVPLSAGGLDLFREVCAGKVGTDFIFTRSDGSQWGRNYQTRPLKAACEQARIEPAISFHELRHTYASLLAQAGADLLTISKLLGHADTRITSKHYAHLCDKTLSSAVENLLPDFGHKPKKKIVAIR